MAFRKRNSSFSSNNRNKRDFNRNAQEDALANVKKALDNPLEEATFESIPPIIAEAYQRAGWNELMPVQAKSIPYLLAGREIMLQSRTGSGKTAAYLMPLIARMDIKNRVAQGLILVPTRELALQVEKEVNKLFGNEISSVSLYGGVPYPKQLDALRRGAQIIIGTPGRVLDHLQRGSLKLQELNMLVLDEADRMLSIGFYPDMKAVQEYLPENILTTLFSATYPINVLKLADEFLKEPEFLSLSDGQVHIAQMQHYSVFCKRMEKDRTLIRLLEIENPSSAIIFCNTKATVHYITQVLQGFGYNAEELSSEISQSRREYVLNRLRRGETRFLVATDVAARGIDIPMLSHVFLYEPPEDKESYIHRAGRTARAGAMGTVISLIDTMERLELEKIASFYGIDLLSYNQPTDDEVENAVYARLIALLEQQKRSLNGLQKERIARYFAIAKKLANPDVEIDGEQDKDSLFLFAMLLDEVYQKSLNPQFNETKNPRGRSNNNRNRKERDDKEAPLTSADTLDSLRDSYVATLKPRQGRGQRNANNKNFPQKRDDRNDRFERSGRDRNDRFERKDRSENNDRFDHSERSERFDRGERNERFERNDRGSNRGERGERSGFKVVGDRKRDSYKDENSFGSSKLFGRKRPDHSDDDVFDNKPYQNSFNNDSASFSKKRNSNRDFDDFAKDSDMRQARRNAFGSDFEDNSDFYGRKQNSYNRFGRNDNQKRPERNSSFNRGDRPSNNFSEDSNDRSQARNRRFDRNSGRNDDRAGSFIKSDRNRNSFADNQSKPERFGDNDFFNSSETRKPRRNSDSARKPFRPKNTKKR